MSALQLLKYGVALLILMIAVGVYTSRNAEQVEKVIQSQHETYQTRADRLSEIMREINQLPATSSGEEK